jgi:hypothetical protein
MTVVWFPGPETHFDRAAPTIESEGYLGLDYARILAARVPGRNPAAPDAHLPS